MEGMEDDSLEHELHGGFETMDVEHARQARTVRAIENALRRGGERTAIQGLLLGLIEDTRAHFESEQALMRRWSYPGYDAHATEHRRLLEELKYIESRQASGGLELTEELVASLRKWLTEHIRVMDHALARYLRERVQEGEEA
jgi:hemerythrin-like metal-binding protein